jgi:hypothetical protein
LLLILLTFNPTPSPLQYPHSNALYIDGEEGGLSQCTDAYKKVCAAGLAWQKQSSYKIEGMQGGFQDGREKNIIYSCCLHRSAMLGG